MNRLLVAAGMLAILIVPAWCGPVVLNPSFELDVLGSPFIGGAATVQNWTYTVGPNGGTTLPHWAVGYADSGGSVTTAGQGNEFVSMGSGNSTFGSGIFSSWSQNVSGFTIGLPYVLSFMLAGQGTQLFWPLTAQIIDTSTQSQNFRAPPSSSNYFRTWQTFTMTFTANAATEQVLFTSPTAGNVGLDNVSITQAPEPGTWSLLGAGIAALALRGAARRAQSRLRG
jgi:hypothetical protein